MTQNRTRHSGFHPLMWWVWAVFVSAFVLLSNNYFISWAAIIAVFLLVSYYRSQSYWYSSFHWALRFALFAFLFRMFIGFAIGVPMPGTTLFTLPEIQLPSFLVGVRLGGPVTTQRLESAFSEASILVAMILIFAAANSLSNPHALLRVLPKRFYGIGLAGVIATSIAPQTAKSITRVRNAKRLRGQQNRKLKSWRGIGMPVLEDALERSIDLAASLESRGYGLLNQPTRYRPENWKLSDVLAICGPAYALLSLLILPATPIWIYAIGIGILSLTPMVAR